MSRPTDGATIWTPAAGSRGCKRSYRQLRELPALDFDITIVNPVTTISVIVSKRSCLCPPSHFLKIRFNIILPSMPGSSKLSLSLSFISSYFYSNLFTSDYQNFCVFLYNMYTFGQYMNIMNINQKHCVPFNFKPSWFAWMPLVAYSKPLNKIFDTYYSHIFPGTGSYPVISVFCTHDCPEDCRTEPNVSAMWRKCSSQILRHTLDYKCY